MRTWWLIAGALVLLLAPSPAAAQKRCTKGIPCGNSCIAANKVCRIGSTAPTSRPTVQEATVLRVATVPEDSIGAPRREWVASSKGRTYYRVGCGGAKGLATANLIYFATEAEAEAGGYKRSRAKGC